MLSFALSLVQLCNKIGLRTTVVQSKHSVVLIIIKQVGNLLHKPL